MKNDDPILCYVDEPWAYFTTQSLDKQWGDDWNDAPYEHNAGTPYQAEGHSIVQVAYEAQLETPREGTINSRYSVEDINAGAIAWLRSPSWSSKKVNVPAGTPLSEFIRLIRSVDGEVYTKVED